MMVVRWWKIVHQEISRVSLRPEKEAVLCRGTYCNHYIVNSNTSINLGIVMYITQVVTVGFRFIY